MFFDRLLKLTSLKSRLLNGSSFTQLYSQEKLPLHKFRREGAMLSPLIAGLLAACGGGGGGGVLPLGSSGGGAGSFEPTTDDFNFYVLDGAIEGAVVYIDENGNGEVDSGDTRFVRDGDDVVLHIRVKGTDTLYTVSQTEWDGVARQLIDSDNVARDLPKLLSPVPISPQPAIGPKTGDPQLQIKPPESKKYLFVQ